MKNFDLDGDSSRGRIFQTPQFCRSRTFGRKAERGGVFYSQIILHFAWIFLWSFNKKKYYKF